MLRQPHMVVSNAPRSCQRWRWAALLILGMLSSLFASAQGETPARAEDPPDWKVPSEALKHKIKKVLETRGYEHGHWGLLVVDGRTGETVCELNSLQLFSPASVTKLFSTAAALVELGPDYRFETPVVRQGEVDVAGTLHGDLILIAQGDPSMGGRTGADGTLLFKDDDHIYAGGNPRSDIVPTDPLAGLDHLAREVRAAGIKQVTGDVLIDDRLFDGAESTGSGPHRLSPIMINDNLVDLLVQPGKKSGEPAVVSFRPSSPFLTLDAQVETVPADRQAKIKVHGNGPRQFTVRGTIPANQSRLVFIHEIDDPASFARTLFIQALRDQGIRIDAAPLGDNSTTALPARSSVVSLPKVGVYTSPPFREFIKVILKVSHNLHASTLPLLMAARHGERTLSAGLRREGEALKLLGVDPATISFGGGAGGSRADLATPQATVTLLRAMLARPDFAAYEAALPVLGRDGTLARAVKPESLARGHARAKTGTFWVEDELTGKAVLTSKALAGYLETASGRLLVLAAFVNNVALDAPRPGREVSDATAEAGRLLGNLCEVLYEDQGRGSPAQSAESKRGRDSKPEVGENRETSKKVVPH